MWKKFVEYIEEEVKRLYATFPQQPKIELTDVLKKKNTRQQKSVTSASKSPITHRIKR